MEFSHFKVEFTKDGAIYDGAQRDAVLAAVTGFTDLIVISHGWNNDVAEATAFYDEFFKSVDDVLGVDTIKQRFDGPLAGRTFGVVRVYWPSKKFSPAELIPAGGVAAVAAAGGPLADANEAALLVLLDELKRDPARLGGTEIDPQRAAAMELAKGFVPRLDADTSARREFMEALRSIVDGSKADPEDGSLDFFQRDALELFQGLSGAVAVAPPPNPGGAASYRDTVGAVGGAVRKGAHAVSRTISDASEGAKAAARRLANYVTYLSMKERAGTVGLGGAAELLRLVRQKTGHIRIHLVGHSFGGRLVTAAASTLAPDTHGVTLMLLQAAFSHNGFGKNYDGNQHDGFFRSVLEARRVSGPVIITHTKNDWAVGIAYPLASRVSRDPAAAFGDENDPYGGMGRNGAQHTPEVKTPPSALLGVGRDYAFEPGKVHNLKADDFIMDHGDVTGHAVAYAFLHACTIDGYRPPTKKKPVKRKPRGAKSAYEFGRDDKATPLHSDTRSKEGGSTSGKEPNPETGATAFDDQIGNYYARVSAPHKLLRLDAERKKQFGLPERPDEAGSYIIELNVRHVGSLPGAANDFEALFEREFNQKTSGSAPEAGVQDAGSAASVVGETPRPRKAARISKSYYRCRLTEAECRQLLDADGQQDSIRRCIYKLWPDFPLKGQIDRSVTTVKADAANRSFDASGDGIVWAVIDSGIDANHPHFGKTDGPEHLLKNDEVIDLHRCFAYAVEVVNGVRIEGDPLASPDLDPELDQEKRRDLIKEHQKQALSDRLGHGTHVAGIIAGSVPSGVDPKVFERQFKSDAEGSPISSSYSRRRIAPRSRLSGVAPNCKLISLRVLNDDNKGRVSSVISALEYIRESLNDNPKIMRVHGVNLSVGYDFDAEMFACGQSPLCVTVDRLVQSGVAVVAAAGNTGYGTIASQIGGANVGLSNTINDPGNAALAITVGSTHREFPHTYGVSFFSSKGPTGDGRLKPDLVAPGERITSCAAGDRLKRALQDHPADDGQGPSYYVDDSGTSMAAPHVSGAIAAFLSIRREFIGKPLEVKRIFLESATPLGRERYFEGHGLVDLMRAIQSV